MLTFVIFYVEVSGPDANQVPSKCRGYDYVRMLDLAFRSASLFHPDCRKIILTDEATEFPGLPSDVQIIRRALNPSKLLHERIVSGFEFLQQQPEPSSHLVMIDGDMLINSELDSLFTDQMDIGLTYRPHPTMPINAGLIAVAKHARAAALEFFKKMVAISQQSSSNWGCDQHALIEAIGSQSFEQRTSDYLVSDFGRIVFWSCETHNFSPHNKLRKILFRRDAHKIIHFKGSRKRLMQPYWHVHLEPGISPYGRKLRWLGLLAASGAALVTRRESRAAIEPAAACKLASAP